jgi:hypothetical protein
MTLQRLERRVWLLLVRREYRSWLLVSLSFGDQCVTFAWLDFCLRTIFAITFLLAKKEIFVDSSLLVG